MYAIVELLHNTYTKAGIPQMLYECIKEVPIDLKWLRNAVICHLHGPKTLVKVHETRDFLPDTFA